MTKYLLLSGFMQPGGRPYTHAQTLRQHFHTAISIPSNLSKTKGRTKLLKKRDFWSKSGTFLKLDENGQNYQVKGKIIYKNAIKKAGQSKEKVGQKEILNQKSGLSL